MRLASFALVTSIFFGACADTTLDESDSEAESAPEQMLGKADAPTITGLYATSTTTLKDGDVPNLELLATGSYVRRRCYHASCALPVAETDHYDTYTSSAGKSYLRFYSTKSVWNAAHDDRTSVAVVADVYEVVKTTTTIKLRKAYSTRWLTLAKKTATSLCTADHGTWTSGSCACPGAGGWSDNGYIGFIAGLGGCITIPGAGEGESDDTGGWYTDDDSTLVGTYCLCDRGSYLSNTGCAAI
jgi:hypothetical protein